jgi:Protein of unknown function (DUF2971)
MTEADSEVRLIENILMPHIAEKKKEISRSNWKFVHYTSAENAFSIIRNGEFWLRNAKCMNDYSEIEYGYAMMRKFFGNPQEFTSTMDQISEGLGIRLLKELDKWWNVINHNTYIGSISEHYEIEDEFGRLSMWRAYGKAGEKAALMLNIPLDAPDVSAIQNIFLIPVHYLASEDELKLVFKSIISNVLENQEYLKKRDLGDIENLLFLALVMLTVCIKHKGFAEEREWRIVYFPHLYASTSIREEFEVISGVPQKVCKVKFDLLGTGLDIGTLISGVLIGPTDYPYVMFDAFSDALDAMGMADSTRRVKISNIPLRK